MEHFKNITGNIVKKLNTKLEEEAEDWIADLIYGMIKSGDIVQYRTEFHFGLYGQKPTVETHIGFSYIPYRQKFELEERIRELEEENERLRSVGKREL